MNHILRKILGITLTFIGLLGLLLPILPGWAFLLPGLIILSSDIPIIERNMKKAEIRYPRFGRLAERFRKGLSDNPPSKPMA